VGQETFALLQEADLEVLLDDRNQSAGSKLKDADLVGIPVQVIIGKSWQQSQELEVCVRATKERRGLRREALVDTVHKLLDKLRLERVE
jgi:prolyl-tRNA synthetase